MLIQKLFQSVNSLLTLNHSLIKLVFVLSTITIIACGGGGGGTEPETAPSTLFANKITIPPGSPQCPNGGVQIDMGFDNNHNNVLDADEITKTEYVCNGTDASSHPFVVYTNPTPNETSVELDTVISAVFNTEMNTDTITASTFTVKDEGGAAVAGTITHNGIVSYFRPNETWTINKKYTVNLASTIKNESGIEMGYEHKFYFNTASDATVIYRGNYATGGAVPVDTNRYSPGNSATVLGNTGGLVKTGYVFAGWNTKADGTGDHYDPGAPVAIGATCVVLYAMWSESHTVTYNANGGTGSVPVDANQYIYGQVVTVPGNTGGLVNGSLYFHGWNTEPDGSGSTYKEGEVFLMNADNIKLYAIWKDTLTVTYNGNGHDSGEVPIDNSGYLPGQFAMVMGNIYSLKKDNKYFVGWNTSPDGNGENYLAGSTVLMSTNNLILYAKWDDTTQIPNNIGFGARKTINIDGLNTLNEWGTDTLLLYDPAADDARFLGSNWCAHEIPWDYVQLHAAWDDNYLYIGIQFVNVTDVIDHANFGPSNALKLYASKMLQSIVFDTIPNSGYSVGGDMWLKNQEFVGLEKPDYQIYFYSDFSESGLYVSKWNGSTWEFVTDGNLNTNLKGTGGDFFVGTNLYGVDPKADDTNPGYYGTSIVNYLSIGHSITYDVFFEIAIPLSIIGINSYRLDNGCIGVFAFNGNGSATDSIPDDFATKTTPGITVYNSPLEWDYTIDDDQYSAPFAIIGAIHN